ncbi:MAG: GTPase HflX [Ruminococcaceae bacterium]|nr:GTPase HflX [Oscillospiraceae bacterium]
MLNHDENIRSKAILVGIITDKNTADEVEKSLSELERLLDTAGGEVFAYVTQSKSTLEARTLIGSGKVQEISELCKNNGIKLVIFDEELSPSQIRNLEEDIGDDVQVIDRSMLILDIFALHAVSGEGKLQVELAQLKYTAPRLMGQGKDLSRLGGGIGTRGPGESKLESDRRHIKRRITALEEELEVLDKNRRTMRVSRDRSGLPKIAIVGYTNAGKSTLLNKLTDAGILAEDKLFATLDPTTRKFELPGGEQVLLTDTVGFIRKLPHHLVNAFKSTLDEAVYSDVVMILCDASDPECMSQLECTEQTLEELGAGGKPTIYVFNKCDKGLFDQPIINRTADKKHVVFISAKTGQGCDELAEVMQEVIHEGKKRVTFKIPNSEMGAMNILYKNATVEDVDYGADFVSITAVVDAKTHGMLKKYDENYPVVSEEDF